MAGNIHIPSVPYDITTETISDQTSGTYADTQTFLVDDTGTTKKVLGSSVKSNYQTAFQAAFQTAYDSRYLQITNNLSEVTPATARTNLDVYSKAETVALIPAMVIPITKAADYVIQNTDVFNTVIVTPNTASQYGVITITLPAGASNSGEMFTIVNRGANNGLVKIACNGAEKILYKGTQLAVFYLFSKGDYLRVYWNGTDWAISTCYSHIEQGWVNRLDWTNVHVGSAFTYDTKNAAINFTGMTITEATSGNTGTVLYDSGGTGNSGILYVYNVTGTGIWTDNRTVTTSSSNTCLVNETTSSKDKDYNIVHNMAVNINLYTIDLFVNASASFTGAQNVGTGGVGDTGAQVFGWVKNQVDTNTFKIQTGTAGLETITDTGTSSALASTDYYSNTIIEFKA